MGSVFQNPRTQFFNTDVNSEIVFGLENRGMPPERMERRLRQVTAELRMEDLADRSIFELSGGEKQKVAFASVYAAEPEILVLDEPSSNLDPQAIEELAALLQKAKEQGKTVVVAEHRLWYLMALADRVIYMKDGRLERDMSMNVFAALPTAGVCRYGSAMPEPWRGQSGEDSRPGASTYAKGGKPCCPSRRKGNIEESEFSDASGRDCRYRRSQRRPEKPPWFAHFAACRNRPPAVSYWTVLHLKTKRGKNFLIW